MAAPAQMRRMLLLGVATVLVTIVQADDFVGCLFSDTLCLDQVEWCYDDMALGRCIGVGAADEDSLYRYVGMTHAQRETVAKELRRVVARGYNLNHPYAQCRLQGALFAVRESLDFHATVCDHLADRDIEYAFQAANSEDINSGNEADEEPLAFVKFTPSINDPHADFADEVYYPPPEEVNFHEDGTSRNELEDVPPEQLLAEVIGEIDDIYNSPYEAVLEPKIVKKSAYFGPDFAFLPAMHRRSEPSIFSRHYNTPQDFRLGQETRDDVEITEGRPSFFEENDLPPYERNPDMTLNSITERIYNPADMKYANQPVSDFAQYSMTPANPLYNIEPNDFDPRYTNGFLSKSPEDNYEPDGRTDEYSTEDQFLEYLPLIDYLNKLNLNADDIEHLLKPENIELLQSLLPDDFEDDENIRNDRSSDDILIAKWLESKAAEKLRNRLGRISDYSIRNYNDGGLYEMTPESRIYYEDDRHGETTRMGEDLGSGEQNEESVSEEINPDKQVMFRELRMKNGGGAEHLNSQRYEKKMDDTVEGVELAAPGKSGVYTEGGIVFVPGNSAPGIHDPMNAEIEKQIDSIMLDPDGFKRKERLDVKKPGPPFDIKTEAKVKINMADAKAKKDTVITHEPISSSEASHEQYDVDTSYAYMDFKDSIRSWKEGHEIVYILAELLHLNPETFTHIRVERNEVTFKVKPNELGLNASMIALKIDEMKGALKEKAGVEVTAAGIGDKTKLPVVRSAIDMETEESILYEGRMLLAGCVIAAVLLAGGTLILIRRHAKSRRKLQDLACGAGMVGPDTEASKDYQELCRSRMASKGGQPPSTTPIEKPEGGLHGRITSLSRESEGGSQQSPSSRSSTSSWSEEPALSNMDISTGHMVLAYMEDHLRNKDRLEQEWVALCAYEAEPCAATEASRSENKDKNRCPDVFPYDHSRVVLGRLANANESDYINASTITDHDPRNPAYIATQGPLPQTAADFWQMIWEQGSVVMVMLTRLTENGTAMCHRYWPEKESELYHIYEVHLVSEHIWCDDYLVRSFYLKNVKTGETRTVTQFHFLSWSEHSVPASTKALLEFRRKVNKSYRGRSCPIVVHCSDGAGRTGTYCLIDMVLNRMAKGAKEIDIAATLEHIRDQRPAMVATRQQFEFVLTAVAEEVHAILKALPPVQPNTTGDKP